MQNPVPLVTSSALPSAGRSEDERSENERSPADGKAGTEGVAAARPDPEVVAKAKRRRFTAAYKQQILAMADTAVEHGGIGALLRREGLYSSHLTKWRHERAASIRQGLEPRKRGPKSKRNPLDRRESKAAACERAADRATAQGRDHNRCPKKSGCAVGLADSGPGTGTLMAAAQDLAPEVGILRRALHSVSFDRLSIGSGDPCCGQSRSSPPRALSPSERETVLAHLHEKRFQDCSPAAVQATLLDEGIYHCSTRTMYRILEQNAETRERRDHRVHPVYKRPELLATAPNELWSWDITKLMGPAKWTYFYLYVILDVFSRYVVGWMVAPRESAELARKLIEDTCRKQQIHPGQLTIHADRGSSMTSKPVAFLMADLGVTKPTADPMFPMTIRTRKASFAPSSTGPIFRIALAPSRTVAGILRFSSLV